MFRLFLTILASVVSAQQTPLSNVKCSGNTVLIEGHLHLTSLDKTYQKQVCTFGLNQRTTFLELERYSGRRNDDDAWTNITFIGIPNVTMSINNNEVTVGPNTTGLLTYSKLEKSMWVLASFRKKFIEIYATAVGSRHFGLVGSAHQMSSYNASIVATTSTGMEQVIRTISSQMPDSETEIAVKTIHELERRIGDIELELDEAAESTERKFEFLKDKIQMALTTGDYTTAIIIITIAGAGILYWTLCRPKKRRFRLD